DPLTNWLAGDTTTLDPASFRALQDDLRATGDSLLDRELIVAAYAIDIAGNVEQVPVSGSNVELNYIGDSVEQIAADEGGDNWVHVVIPAEGTDIDTTLTANIRYVNNVNPALSRDLGQAAIVEYPPGPDTFIVAEFDVTILPPDPNSAFDTESVYYELSANGVRVTEVGDFELGDYEPADGKRRVRITLPDPTYAPPGLGNPDAVVNYVFHAYTVLQGGTVDATPAQYHFKVVPGTVQDYLESSMGGKPVIVFETD
ncbi:MAG: hypothetical protein GWP08_21810, partial [Nitrospiraceae bacterium]|nr:hypothetical protein [Nitrospiraceae bacterium]